MSRLWWPIDKVADWIVLVLSARAQMRVGVLAFLASLYFWWGLFTTKEPVHIYLMSAAALTFTGLNLVLQAETLEVLEEDEQT